MSETDDTILPTGTNTVNVIDSEDGDAPAARLVYANSLLMSEIYSWLPGSADRKNRTLLSKSGWEEAARVLFRRVKYSALVPLHYHSSPVCTLCCLRSNELLLLNGLMKFTLIICLGADRTDPGIRSRHVLSSTLDRHSRRCDRHQVSRPFRVFR